MDRDPSLGPAPSDEELQVALEKQRSIKKEQVNVFLYEVFKKTDYIHFSEFMQSKSAADKKGQILQERKLIKEKAEQLEETLMEMSFEKLISFSVEEYFKEQGWL